MSLKKWSLALGFCFLVTAVLATVKFIQIKAAMDFAASFPETMEAVEFTEAKDSTWTPEVSVVAETVAMQSIELRNELGGVIENVYFKSGEQVKKGQLLLSMETSQEKARLAAIRADVKLAQAEYERALSVVAKGAAPESTKDQREAERDSLIADERELQATIDKKNIRAPFDATAGLHELEVGQYLTPGSFLTDLVGINKNIWVDFNLPQQIATLSVGDAVELSAKGFYKGRKTALIIARDAMVNSQSRNVRFRAEFENPEGKLFSGMAVVAHVPTGESAKGVTIPATAVRYDTSGPFVFLLEPIIGAERGTHRATKRPVEIASEKRQQVLITNGLKASDEIATLGSFKLRENILVNAVSPSKNASDIKNLAVAED